MKLAIISLSTFGYFERLAQKISSRGIQTEFFDERPANNLIAKLKYRILPKKIVRRIAQDHTRAICEKIVAEGFTHVLITFFEVISNLYGRFLNSIFFGLVCVIHSKSLYGSVSCEIFCLAKRIFFFAS